MRRALGRRPLGAAALTLLATLLGGCGYTIGGNLPPHIKSVAVPVFKNLTQQPAIENVITAGVVNAFVVGGRLKVVPVEQADSLLEGEVTSYNVESIAFDSNINAQVFRLRVALNVQFRDVRNNTMLWRQEGLQDQADFRVAGQVSQTIALEESAARQAAVEIGRRVVSLALDRF
jgi:lipopolysaccharide assembly LptE-like protein